MPDMVAVAGSVRGSITARATHPTDLLDRKFHLDDETIRRVIVVRTTVPVDPARRDEAMNYIDDLLAQSRSEPGTVRYEAVKALDDPNTIRFFEQYEDATAAEAHTESDPYRRFVAALPEFVDGEIETIQFETDAVSVSTFTAEEASASAE